MSHWDPNQVPPQEGYPYFNQNFGNSQYYYNVGANFDNFNYYSPQQYGQVNYYVGQQQPYYSNSDNVAGSSRDVTQGSSFQGLNSNDRNVGRSGSNLEQSGSTLEQSGCNLEHSSSNISKASFSKLTPTAKAFQPNIPSNEEQTLQLRQMLQVDQPLQSKSDWQGKKNLQLNKELRGNKDLQANKNLLSDTNLQVNATSQINQKQQMQGSQSLQGNHRHNNSNQNQGAVKKDQNYRRNKHSNDYNQGGSSSRSSNNGNNNNTNNIRNSWHRSGGGQNEQRRDGYYEERGGRNRYKKSNNNRSSQQSQVLEETKQFLQKLQSDKPTDEAGTSEEVNNKDDNKGNHSGQRSYGNSERSYRNRKNYRGERNEGYNKNEGYHNTERYNKNEVYYSKNEVYNKNETCKQNERSESYSKNYKENKNNRNQDTYYSGNNRQQRDRDDRSFRNQYKDTNKDKDNTFNRNFGGETRNDRDSKFNSNTKETTGNINKYSGNNSNIDKSDNNNSKNQYDDRRERKFNENWRSNKNSGNKEEKKNSSSDYLERKSEKTRELRKKLDAASQRERLEEMVTRRLLECLVCCEGIRHTDEIWSCKQCYHILHLTCVIRWAKTSKLDAGWRCPACQNMNNTVPNEYRCFCGKVSRPPLEPGTTPHSCGEMCGRKGGSCDHTCTLLCHPGPCPDCTIMVKKSCNCGATTMQALCSAVFDLVCKNVCNKTLDCGIHKCTKICHTKECESCLEFVRQECFCGKVGRKVRCTLEIGGATRYECGDICGKPLDCGNHYCQKLCHDGDCDPCEKAPEKVGFCPCGQTKLEEKRTSCLDPIPCCDKICNKPLKCGQPSMPHQCKSKCHEGSCPPCLLTTLVRCRCGHMDKEIVCVELKSKADDARCEKRCTKKRQCCKHKCNQLCCIDIDHICPLICNHMLSCGLHRCEETCHRGRCPPCWRTSFQELYCECGSSVLYPPVACGTRPPPCSKPCSRPRLCGHEVNHNCHIGPCPPCTILTVKWCHGKHEKRNTIPCHQGDFSCGLPCGKEMSCGRHKCIQPCHTGPCPSPCTQPCTVSREACSHPCNAPCHDPPCPDTPCKQIVKVSCQCGLRSSSRICMDLAGEYQKIAMSQLASKMADIQRGQTVDISDIISGQKKPGTLKTLECNEECRIVERNRRLTIGLQIRNPDLSSKLMPKYSDYMKQWGKKDVRFCQMVHDKLTELVQLAKTSKHKSRSHSFETMNRDKRQFVHEYCTYFGCTSAAYDAEPNRNVVATAMKETSWLPSLSLPEVIQRENGQRKVPGPVLAKSVAGKSESVSLNKLPTRMPRPPTPPGEYVDYFDNPPIDKKPSI